MTLQPLNPVLTDGGKFLPGSSGWLIGLLLLSIRAGVVLWATPVGAAIHAPPSVKVWVTLALAAVLSASTTDGAVLALAELSTGALVSMAASELLNGLVLALGIQLAFGAFAIAGRLVDTQIGFGVAQVLDPQSRRQVPLLTGALQLLGATLFFISGAHHAVLRGLALSLDAASVGQSLMPDGDAIGWISRQAIGMFALGVALLAPVLAALFMIELGLGVLARSAPQMNIFMLGMPIKGMAGLTLLALWCTSLAAPIQRVYEAIFTAWRGLLAHG